MIKRPIEKSQVYAAGIIVVALFSIPAPILPPHGLAEAMQSLLGLGWTASYFITAIGLRVAFYGPLGALAVFAAGRAPTLRKQMLRGIAGPLVVILLGLIIRSLKLGHLPEIYNTMVPIASCLVGGCLAAVFLKRGVWITLIVMTVLMSIALWCVFNPFPSGLRLMTQDKLSRIVAIGGVLPGGDQRFSDLAKTAFAALVEDPVRDNRASILAMGITVGHDRLARFAGLKRDSQLVRKAAELGRKTTLRGRSDWARHYWLSAGIAAVENPFIGDAAGLLKEQLDRLSGGSGFSFGDLAADQSGVMFTRVATQSKSSAYSLQNRLKNGFVIDDFVPSLDDLPEGLGKEAFQNDYGTVGSARYRAVTREIKNRLKQCPGLQ